MFRKTTCLPLSLVLLLASCTPSVQVQTGRGAANIPVEGGPIYALAAKTPVEQLTDQTPGDQVITFTACPKAGVRAAEVRRYGPEAALEACQKAVQRAGDVQDALGGVQLVAAPFFLAGTFFVFRLFACALNGC